MKHEFCDECPDCRPVLLDIQTKKVMANNTPMMRAINEIWDTQTCYGERKAFIDVTYHNSQEENDRFLCEKVVNMFETKLKELEKEVLD